MTNNAIRPAVRYPKWPTVIDRSPPMAQTLTPDEVNEARALYAEFFARYPLLKNPTDINRAEKAFFLTMKGWEKIKLMQRARKAPYDFTKPGEEDADEE